MQFQQRVHTLLMIYLKLILDGPKEKEKAAKQESGSNIINLISDFLKDMSMLMFK